MDDQEPSWQRQLVIGLSVLLVIGVLIGGIGAFVGLKFADYAGIGHVETTSNTPESILPSTGNATKQAPTRRPPPPSTVNPPPPPQHAMTLTASPANAASYQQVNLTGSFQGHDGTTLQVQRSVGNGPWADFPTTTHVSGGQYATFIKTGMVGTNHFRMIDTATGVTSNVVTVKIG